MQQKKIIGPATEKIVYQQTPDKTPSTPAPQEESSYYPYYFQNTLSNDLQKIYKKNGTFTLVKSLQLQVITDIAGCKSLWEEFSPKKSLFDTWEFRYAFWEGYKYPPYFVVLKNNRENFALLPLWFQDKRWSSEDRERYFWYGSWWQEDNNFFVKDEVFVPLLLSVCPKPIHLNAITLNTVLWAQKYVDFEPDDPKYILDISHLKSVDEYLKNFKKKRRYNLKRDKRKIEILNPQIIIDDFSHFDALIDLSKKRFAQKGEDTDWEDPQRVDTFRKVIELGQNDQSYKIRMISVLIGDKIAAVDLIAIFNDCYYPLKCGYEVGLFPGIGNFVNLLEIEDALKLGMKKMDFLEYGYGWKEKWFQKVKLFKYEKD